MKILIFSVAYHPFVGGGEIAIKEITDRIPGTEFHLVTVNLDGKQKAEEKIGNVFVYRVGKGTLGKIFFPYTGLFKGLALHRRLNFDATWAMMAAYAGFAALFFKYLKPKISFILTLQEGDPIEYIKRQVWFIYPLWVDIFRKADRIQTISNYLADFARSMKAKAPIVVIPNGVDVSLFSREYPKTVLDNLKATLGKRTGEIFLVTSSRLAVKNGLATVIKALPSLKNEFKFLIIGTGPLEASLKELAEELNVEDRVKFVGFVEHSELPKYLKVSDIFVRPSLSEGMGNSFVEAMAAGIPVVATSVGGIPDFLKNQETGLFCQVEDPLSLAEQVTRLVYDPKLKEKLVSSAKKMVTEKYEWNLISKDMKEKIFEQI